QTSGKYPVHATMKHFHKPSSYIRVRHVPYRSCFQMKPDSVYVASLMILFGLFGKILPLLVFLFFVNREFLWGSFQLKSESEKAMLRIQLDGDAASFALIRELARGRDVYMHVLRHKDQYSHTSHQHQAIDQILHLLLLD